MRFTVGSQRVGVIGHAGQYCQSGKLVNMESLPERQGRQPRGPDNVAVMAGKRYDDAEKLHFLDEHLGSIRGRQAALAKHLRVSEAEISRWRKGRRELPLRYVRAIERFFRLERGGLLRSPGDPGEMTESQFLGAFNERDRQILLDVRERMLSAQPQSPKKLKKQVK